MSVPKSRRGESSMQYIDTAMKIAANVLAFANGLPKRMSATMVRALFDYAQEGVYHVKSANRVYVKDDATYELRRGHLLEAIGCFDHVAYLLEILYEHDLRSGKEPNENRFLGFANDIEDERRLIRGVMKKDAGARQAAGEHPDG